MNKDYLEQLRVFLLGKAAFPANAASILYVSPSAIPPLSVGYPERVAQEIPRLLPFLCSRFVVLAGDG
jgi:hypothetical protein